MKSRLALWLVLAMQLSVADADIWRWTDPETGVVVYGGQPPTDASAGAVQIGKGAGSAEAAEAVNVQPDNSADRIKARVEELRDQRHERDKQKQEAQEEKLATDQRNDACQSARRNLETLSRRDQAAIIKNGERRALTEDERQGHLASTRTFIDENCAKQ